MRYYNSRLKPGTGTLAIALQSRRVRDPADSCPQRAAASLSYDEKREKRGRDHATVLTLSGRELRMDNDET